MKRRHTRRCPANTAHVDPGTSQLVARVALAATKSDSDQCLTLGADQSRARRCSRPQGRGVPAPGRNACMEPGRASDRSGKSRKAWPIPKRRCSQ